MTQGQHVHLLGTRIAVCTIGSLQSLKQLLDASWHWDMNLLPHSHFIGISMCRCKLHCFSFPNCTFRLQS